VTAPLRRLADRYALKICASVSAGVDVPDWVRAGLPGLPGVMADTGRRAGARYSTRTARYRTGKICPEAS
jgi:hypothetical protein